jgi:hypothetical protein
MVKRQSSVDAPKHYAAVPMSQDGVQRGADWNRLKGAFFGGHFRGVVAVLGVIVSAAMRSVEVAWLTASVPRETPWRRPFQLQPCGAYGEGRLLNARGRGF